MRIMALDIGEKRIGVAISDPAENVASPVCVVPYQEVITNGKAWRRILEDWEPELLVCGLPLTLSGQRGVQAKRVCDAAEQIAKNCALPLEFTDERLSSVEAKRSLRDLGYDEAAMRGKIDMIAASLFLQSWLDSHKTQQER
ncbi:Holliday junction resolvase RuvX [Adlercreutzia sp. ZJ154]|uniref:Holliday junction resolvase RuvX n=1 Tax=Adlercreutzia sp. ZJ154 TaxID=2709790 RepID=UPI0013E9C970|nr:Holliday junction resolvase RuvX [Adlercreutzia sp. ZJ154]